LATASYNCRVDPISLIVAALAAGAAAGLKDAAAASVRDAYAAVKAFIQRKYGNVDLASIERMPQSEAKRESVAEDLRLAGARDDAELFMRARELFELVRDQDPDVAAVVGFDFEDSEAEWVRLGRVFSAGTGARFQRSTVRGGIDIGEIHAGAEDSSPKTPS
jgi:hypothetical protein